MSSSFASISGYIRPDIPADPVVLVVDAFGTALCERCFFLIASAMARIFRAPGYGIAKQL